MSLQFDTSKKTEKELVLERRVPLKIEGKNYVYFMTNDFTVISEKLKTFGCRIPTPEDFIENPILAKCIKTKMQDLGAVWSITITLTVAVLNYYDINNSKSYLVHLENLTDDGTNSSIISMFHYVDTNNVKEIESLIKQGYDIDQCIDNGMTPLMYACSKNAYCSVEVLWRYGADINATDLKGQTPLMYAVASNSIQAILFLMLKNIKIDEKDISGSTALIRAAYYGYNEIVKLLIRNGANIDAVNYSGETALIQCILNERNETAEILIKYGASLKVKNKLGKTPFVFAAGKNARKILMLFLQNTEISNDEYALAVFESVKHGHEATTLFLVDNSKNQKELVFTAIISACLYNRANIITLCLDYNCNLDDTLFLGMTPLMIACYMHSRNVAEELIKYGADINKADEDGMTALMYAASKNDLPLITLLLQIGADKKAKDKNGKDFEDYSKELDRRTYLQMLVDRMKTRVAQENQERDNSISNEPQPFYERLDGYIQKYQRYYPKNGVPDIYKAAGISKQTFSKILKNVNIIKNPNWHPEKETVIKLVLGLELTLNEAKDLLHSAGYTLSTKDKQDIEIQKLLSEKNYRLMDWINRIYDSTGIIFFKSLIEDEENED